MKALGSKLQHRNGPKHQWHLAKWCATRLGYEGLCHSDVGFSGSQRVQRTGGSSVKLPDLGSLRKVRIRKQ
jgi:hypothetical protein